MQRRAVRLILVALLVISGLGAAYGTWDHHARIRQGVSLGLEVDARLDRMSAAAAALGAAQQAYVAPGQQRGDALTRASVLVQQLYDDIGALRRLLASNDAPAALLAFGSTLDGLVNVDDRAREHLRLEQELMAADLVYTEARQAIETLGIHLDALRTAERRYADSERTALFAREASVVGSIALVWFAAVLVLARRPRERQEPAASDIASIAPARTSAGPAPHVDLRAAVAVCTELARLSSPSALPVALTHAARALDAAGLVVWLGAGEELFAATAHGYSPAMLARLGPISRTADNATAEAWRTATLGTVTGSAGKNGAIVAPLFGPSGCFGVLAAEIRHGREGDEGTQTVAALIAAQLSTVVAPWPAPSQSGDAIASSSPEPNSQPRTAASA